MAIVLIFPALMLLTLAGVAILAMDTPVIEESAPEINEIGDSAEYQLAA